MSAGKVGTDFIVGFAVFTGTGAPATGIAAGDFTPRVRCLDTAADDGSVANVVEIGAGRYSLTIRGAFTTAQGAGNYLWSVEVNSTTPKVRHIIADTVPFHATDIDDVPTAAEIDTQLSGTHGAGDWEGAGLTPTEQAQLEYIWTHAGGDPTNKMNHTRAEVGTPGRAWSDDTLVDQEVIQVDDDTATFEQQ